MTQEINYVHCAIKENEPKILATFFFIIYENLAATHTHKQSTVTFELCNQHYYGRDAIGIKMTYRNLPY